MLVSVGTETLKSPLIFVRCLLVAGIKIIGIKKNGAYSLNLICQTIRADLSGGYTMPILNIESTRQIHRSCMDAKLLFVVDSYVAFSF